MEDNQSPSASEDDIDSTEMRIWIEFGVWCAFVMTPINWWLQGPSVSTDQFVVRIGMVVVSFLVGVGMRLWANVPHYPVSPHGTKVPAISFAPLQSDSGSPSPSVTPEQS